MHDGYIATGHFNTYLRGMMFDSYAGKCRVQVAGEHNCIHFHQTPGQQSPLISALCMVSGAHMHLHCLHIHAPHAYVRALGCGLVTAAQPLLAAVHRGRDAVGRHRHLGHLLHVSRGRQPAMGHDPPERTLDTGHQFRPDRPICLQALIVLCGLE